MTYTACICRQATVLVCSSLPPRYNMEFLSASGGRTPKIQIASGRDLAGVPDFIWVTAGTICRGLYNFEIFDNNCLSCYEMSSDFVIQGLQVKNLLSYNHDLRTK